LLLERGAAYRCFCTPQRLESMRAEQRARKEPERYDRHCAGISREESDRRAAAGERFVIRQRMPASGSTTLHDLVMGDVTFSNDTLDDHVLLKSDGYPTYHLAFAVDDHDSRITHVIRGDGWLPSAPKHLLLFEAFGWSLPAFAHLPLVHGQDGKPLAKRHGAKDVLEYRDAGYLPEALINFMAFLGWSPGTVQDLFTLDELVQVFSLERVQPSPAIANLQRLDWLDGQLIRRLPPDELARRIAAFMPGIPAERLSPLIPLVQERLRTLAEGPELLRFFFIAPVSYDLKQLVPKGKDAGQAATALQRSADLLDSKDDWTHQDLDGALRGLAAELDLKPGDLFMTLRVAITGRTVTPPLIESMLHLQHSDVIARLQRAQAALQSGTGGAAAAG
jgi:glutamyl-tRNA synthetase